MALSSEQQTASILATHETAWAMVEDMAHTREVLSKPNVEAAEVRRLSNILRRLLIDNNGDLRKVATPRIGRVELIVPDVLPYLKSAERQPFTLWSAGTATIFNLQFAAMALNDGPVARDIEGYDPDRRVPVHLDTF